MAENYKKEPVYVDSGDKVLIKEELPNFVMRVKVLKDGQEGLMPAWNVEDPFERLARLNMEYNEAVSKLYTCVRCGDRESNGVLCFLNEKTTCPKEEEAKNGSETSSSSSSTACTHLAHVHSHCPAQTAQTRRQFVSKMRKLGQESPSSSGSDESLPTTPELEQQHQSHFPSSSSPTKSKSVKFNASQRKVVFRYYLPANVNKKEKRKRFDDDSDLESDLPPAEAEIEDDDSAWWWDGWEEDPDASSVDIDLPSSSPAFTATLSSESLPLSIVTPPPPQSQSPARTQTQTQSSVASQTQTQSQVQQPQSRSQLSPNNPPSSPDSKPSRSPSSSPARKDKAKDKVTKDFGSSRGRSGGVIGSGGGASGRSFRGAIKKVFRARTASPQ